MAPRIILLDMLKSIQNDTSEYTFEAFRTILLDMFKSAQNYTSELLSMSGLIGSNTMK